MAESEDRRTVRGVPDALWEAASAAAKRGGVTIGRWLCNAIDRAIDAERQPIDMLPAPTYADGLSDRSDLAAVSGALQAMAAAASAGLPVAPVAARDAVRVMRGKLREAGGLAPVGVRRSVAAGDRAAVGSPGPGPVLLNGAGVVP